MTASETSSERPFVIGVLTASAVVLAALFWIVYGASPSRDAGALAWLPQVNAAMNATSAVFQMAAVFAIKRRAVGLHRALMAAALTASAIFLVGYLVYHQAHGDTPYPLTAPYRTAYLAILISHIVLSVAVVPMILLTLVRALRGTFEKHKRLARWTFPIWIYVSVTGVIVFLMLRGAYAG